jgi:hypothetical protein
LVFPHHVATQQFRSPSCRKSKRRKNIENVEFMFLAPPDSPPQVLGDIHVALG